MKLDILWMGPLMEVPYFPTRTAEDDAVFDAVVRPSVFFTDFFFLLRRSGSKSADNICALKTSSCGMIDSKKVVILDPFNGDA